MLENWEDAILESIALGGGQSNLQWIYKTISRFVNLTDEHLRETQWGGRPAYHHTIRSYVSKMTKSGELSNIGPGEYRLTKKGRKRLNSKRQPAMSRNNPSQKTHSKRQSFPSDRQSDLPPTEAIASEEAIRKLRETYLILRNPKLVQHVKSLHRCQCQLCGVTIRLHNDKLYAEVHHLKPLGKPHNGPDSIENMLCVCPNCHVQLDFGAIKLNPKDIRLPLKHKSSKDYIKYHNAKVYRN